MKKYGLKWIWKQTKGTRGYLLLLSLAGIAIGVVNMGMTTVLMNLVNIAAGNLKQSIGKNVVWAIFFRVSNGSESDRETHARRTGEPCISRFVTCIAEKTRRGIYDIFNDGCRACGGLYSLYFKKDSVQWVDNDFSACVSVLFELEDGLDSDLCCAAAGFLCRSLFADRTEDE